jgi:hypothetical protein
MAQRVVDAELKPRGYEQLTDLSAAVGLSKVPVGAIGALIQAEDQYVRWHDVIVPTANLGMTLAAGDTIWYVGNLDKIKFIEMAASAIINVSYYSL